MSAAIRIHEPLGERAATLPLTLGGDDADLRLPGVQGLVLTLALTGGQWRAQPSPDAAVAINGIPLQEATLLDEGDVIGAGGAQVTVYPAAARLEVAHLAGNDTVAPLRRESLPGDEVVAGVREIFAAGAPAVAGSSDAPMAAHRGRRLAWGGAAAALVLLAGLLFALVPVPFTLEPAAADVKASGLVHWHGGDRVFLLPGRRTLTFSHQGYRSHTVTLDVQRALAAAQPMAIELAKLPGLLAVDTGGVQGELLVDGKSAGKVPGEIEVEAGARELRVRAPRHADYLTRLEIEGRGVHQQLQVQLQPATGWLMVDTTPAGAQVSIDGKEAGPAPQRLELDAGLRQLAIVAPGRRAWRSEVAIIAGETLDLGRVDLALPPPVAARPPAATPVVMGDAAESAGSAPAAMPEAPRPPPPARLRSTTVGTLVLLPAGRYTQGSDRREQGRRANEAQREVILTRPFYLAETEVTNAQFRAFRAGHASGIAMDKSQDLDPQAVTNVGWNDAVEFCNWLSLREGLPAAYERRDGRWQLIVPHNRGYRLPTEAEWEYAARYVDGQRWQRYAWGDVLPPPAGAANLAGQESLPTKPGPEVRLATSLPTYRDEHAVVAPVASYARSAAGLQDLGGNVSEWMHDVYVSLPEAGPVTDPFGPATDGAHAIRGANWRTAAIAELRLAWRDRATGPAPTIGFRVARYAEDAT
jgi:formylglycine-generating enzyme required for sulfatase activity